MRDPVQVSAAANNVLTPNVVTASEALDSALGFVRRHFGLALLLMLAAYAVWAADLAFITPNFVATAKVLVDQREAAQLAQQQPSSVVDTDEVPTEVNLLASDNLAEMVIKDLDLTKDRELSGPGLSSSAILALGLAPTVAWLTSKLEPSSPAALDPSTEALRKTLNEFRRRLRVKPVASSHVIDISFSSSDPRRAAQIANAAAQGLISLELSVKSAAARQANAWSHTRLQELRTQMEAAQKDLVEFKASNSVSSQVALHDLEGRIQALHNVYNNFLRQETESAQRPAFPVAQSQVLALAAQPLESNRPNGVLAFAVVTLLGAAAGFGIGLLRDMRDRTFRTRAQLEAGLGAECIAVIPRLDRRRLRRVFNGQRKISNRLRESLKDTQFVEALRSIELAVDVSRSLNGSPKSGIIVGITSALPGEGKSTLAAALAFHTAQRAERVLLVDCDLRNPSLSRAISPKARYGLSEMAQGTVSREDAVQNGEAQKVNFLPARSEISGQNGNAVIDCNSMRDVFASLRRQYDVIFLDLPPLAPVVDARAVAELIDAYLLVVEWGQTKIDVVQHALGGAKLLNDKLLGAVLNKVNLSHLSRYDRHLAEYYSAEYFQSRPTLQ